MVQKKVLGFMEAQGQESQKMRKSYRGTAKTDRGSGHGDEITDPLK